MVDLHSHVLFGIDDGADTIEDSLAILKRAERKGIKKIMATPHFTIGEDVDEFVAERNSRLEKLKEAAADEGVDVKLKAGAEVYITDELFNECDLDKLTLGDSNVLLAEFRYHNVRSDRFIEYVEEIIKNGLNVLVAHPERYSYLVHNPMLLDALVSRGVMLQVNAISLFEGGPEGDFARMLVGERIATVIGTDTHHANSRRLGAAGELILKGNLDTLIKENPEIIFENSDEINKLCRRW